VTLLDTATDIFRASATGGTGMDWTMVTRGPHIDVLHPWPMSLVSAVFGAEDDEEIQGHLGALVNVRGVCALTMFTRPLS